MRRCRPVEALVEVGALLYRRAVSAVVVLNEALSMVYQCLTVGGPGGVALITAFAIAVGGGLSAGTLPAAYAAGCIGWVAYQELLKRLAKRPRQ